MTPPNKNNIGVRWDDWGSSPNIRAPNKSMHTSVSYLTILGFWTAAVQARSLWSSIPAAFGPKESDDWIMKTAYPIGNGRLGGTYSIMQLPILLAIC